MKEIAKMKLDGTKNGKITVSIVEEPYGKNSASVASIGVSLQESSNEPDWKVHLPKANIDDVIDALQKAKAEL
ncbi:hypothetical protein MNB_SV-15-84 [hydrothermal vent metagenome]|uniref:Uncharacterized protein n=1 Tax=hydrothermal vent metagenome TaxID=652676 RepID=A0A1W1EI72_9ZZZZ